MNLKSFYKYCILLCVQITWVHTFFAQSLINGDLEETFSNTSTAPWGWEMVPFDDPNCEANYWYTATPDIYTWQGPDPGFGLCGYPYSGNTFVTGVYGHHTTSNAFSHEGIQQTINGFILDSIYTIGFYQTVRVRNSCYDPSGSWIFIVDDQVVGISEPTFTSVGEFVLELEWEKREFTFKATSTTHTLKFLPVDNDSSFMSMEYGETGMPCMGIDSIYLTNYSCERDFDLGPDLLFCEDKSAILDAFQVNATYMWSNGDSSNKINVNESGLYSVEVTVHDCPLIDSITYFDTIQVTVVPFPVFDFGADEQYICKYDTLTLNVFTENSTYLWQNGSVEPTLRVNNEGVYYVSVDRMGCKWNDTVKIGLKHCLSNLELPNVFSPNADGVNDKFIPIVSNGIVSMHTKILNRWGDIVYQSESLMIDWDGKNMKGHDVSDGVYFLKVDAVDEHGMNYTIYDNVHLIR